MEKLIHTVLSSDKFEVRIKNGEKGYFDKLEQVFIPKSIVPYLTKEITEGPASILGLDNLDAYYDLCQVRIKREIKKSFAGGKALSYKTTLMKYLSTEFLKSFADSEINFASLYIDLVGSTLMSMKLSSEKLSTLINIFTQEMSAMVSINQGYVLKYAGDAIIAFFPQIDSLEKMCEDALNCAKDMKELLNNGINIILEKNGFEPLNIRIGIESGTNKIMFVGGTVDIIGRTMNMAAKVTSMSKPNGIAIGQYCYSMLDEKFKNEFKPMELDSSFWKYKDTDGNMYKVFEYS